jgi:putative oxidoreductase
VAQQELLRYNNGQQTADTFLRVSIMCDKKLLAGRILLASFFGFASLYKLFNLGLFASEWMKIGRPFSNTLVIVIGLAELACAIAVAVGFKVRFAAYALVAFLVIAIPIYHDFWNVAGEARIMKLNGLFLYLSLAGGFLMLAAAGAGRYSVDRA